MLLRNYIAEPIALIEAATPVKVCAWPCAGVIAYSRQTAENQTAVALLS